MAFVSYPGFTVPEGVRHAPLARRTFRAHPDVLAFATQPASTPEPATPQAPTCQDEARKAPPAPAQAGATASRDDARHRQARSVPADPASRRRNPESVA